MALVKSGWLLRQSTILRRWKKNWFDLWSHGHLLFYDDQHRHDLEDRIHMKVDCINIRVGNECRGLQPPEGKSRDCLLQIICRDGKVLNLCAESADDCLAWKIALQDARTNEPDRDSLVKTGTYFQPQQLMASMSVEWENLVQVLVSAIKELIQRAIPFPQNRAYIGSEVTYEDNSISSAPPPYTAYATPSPEVYGYPQYNGAYPPPGPQVIYTSNGQTYIIPYQYPNQGPYGHPPANHVIIRERYRDNDGDLALGMLAGAATGMALGSLFWVF